PISPRPGLVGARLRREVLPRLKRGETLVASQTPRGKPFGFIHLIFRPSVMIVDLLAVAQKQQNRRWGSALLAAAEQYGSEQGCRESRLYVDSVNERGIRFYLRNGYSSVRYLKEADCYEMVKPLAAPWSE